MLGVWRTVRAALPQVVERRGHLVVVSSVYAFVNGVLNSPYAAAKAGVESLGRSLRAELTPLGAERQRRLLRLGRHQDGPGRGSTRSTGAGGRSELPAFMLQADLARTRRPRRWSVGSKSARRGSSPRAGGAMSRRCAGILNPLLDRRARARRDPRSRRVVARRSKTAAAQRSGLARAGQLLEQEDERLVLGAGGAAEADLAGAVAAEVGVEGAAGQLGRLRRRSPPRSARGGRCRGRRRSRSRSPRGRRRRRRRGRRRALGGAAPGPCWRVAQVGWTVAEPTLRRDLELGAAAGRGPRRPSRGSRARSRRSAFSSLEHPLAGVGDRLGAGGGVDHDRQLPLPAPAPRVARPSRSPSGGAPRA